MQEFTMTIEKYLENFVCTTQEGGFYTGFDSKKDEIAHLLKQGNTVPDFKKFATDFCKKRNYTLISQDNKLFTYTK